MSDKNDVQDLDNQILKQMMHDFLEEALELLDQLNLNLIQLESEPESEDLINQIFRIVHTIKGSAAFAGLEQISLIGRKLEEIFGNIRKGKFKITSDIIDTLFDGLDALNTLRDKAAGGDMSDEDISNLLAKLDQVSVGASSDTPDTAPEQEAEEMAPLELLNIYRDGYNQLAALKHLIFSSVHLMEEEALAVLFSKQIFERMTPESNGVWLVKDGKTVQEISRDGERIPESERQSLDIESSEILQRVIDKQLVVWQSSFPEVKEILSGFESPVIIPLKAQPTAFGFLVLDPEESTEVEVYQFVGEFAAMILNISKLHKKVEDQRQELDEMTAILFKQNNQLSSLYHVELDLMRITNPNDLCRIVTEAFVHDLETRTAAIFLKSESSDELTGLWGSGGLQGIDSMKFSVDSVEQIQQSLETGRIISQNHFPGPLKLGSNTLTDWIVMGLKGRETTHGVIIAELDDEDITDSMSILANYSGILLDNLILQQKFKS